MQHQAELFPEEKPRYTIVPRDYQHEAYRKTIELWEGDCRGALQRLFTGAGKTILACMLIDYWLSRGPNYRAMVLSYEVQLVHQFAQEIEEVLRITPAIEQGTMQVDPLGEIPKIIVASRQSLARHTLATDSQKNQLREYGVDDFGLLTSRRAESLIKAGRKGIDTRQLVDEVDAWNNDYRCDHDLHQVSRLHKFDNELNWCVFYDEAHKYTHSMKSMTHLIDWFEANPRYRCAGLTATPRRYDKVSLSRLFPGVAIDMPLNSPVAKCAVSEGYSVPLRQRFINVKGIDFKEIKRLYGTSQGKWDAAVARALEEQLTTLVDPTLNIVGDRQCLIFSPSVQLAREVAEYINARRKCRCPDCAKVQWWPTEVLRSAQANCRNEECTRILCVDDATTYEDQQQAEAVWGEIPHADRQQIYNRHQNGAMQFLSTCQLCREGYNDVTIAAVAVFRPVSKAAVSLAEQMKGRGARPLKGTVEGLSSPEERKAAIAASDKPDCLIIDLVGVSGLEETASTVEIYAQGIRDDIKERAEQKLLEGEEDVNKAIDEASEEIAEEEREEEKRRKEFEENIRKEAERRAAAGATAEYTEHEVGYHGEHSPGVATEKQIRFLHFLGMDLIGWEPSVRQARQMITLLKEKELPPAEVAHIMGLEDHDWEPAIASSKQKFLMTKKGIPWTPNISPVEASKRIDRALHGGGVSAYEIKNQIKLAKTNEDLTNIGKEMIKYRHRYSGDEWMEMVEAGKIRRNQI